MKDLKNRYYRAVECLTEISGQDDFVGKVEEIRNRAMELMEICKALEELDEKTGNIGQDPSVG